MNPSSPYKQDYPAWLDLTLAHLKHKNFGIFVCNSGIIEVLGNILQRKYQGVE